MWRSACTIAPSSGESSRITLRPSRHPLDVRFFLVTKAGLAGLVRHKGYDLPAVALKCQQQLSIASFNALATYHAHAPRAAWALVCCRKGALLLLLFRL